ncbi:MAG: L-histidine N(alpha)-methyltransferase, partial [Acidobacteriota bacterium]|nr:L-histidine N(alpha)-methyltransferase [Acidobacteriota bacterium]
MTLPTGLAAPPADSVRDFAMDVRRDLALTPKQLQSKYLYDGLGSTLFEAISRLPWYRITRAEARLLSSFAPQVVS